MKGAQLFDIKLDSIEMDFDLPNLSLTDYKYQGDSNATDLPSSSEMIFEFQLKDQLHNPIEDISIYEYRSSSPTNSSLKYRSQNLVLNSNFNLIYSNWVPVIDYKSLDRYHDKYSEQQPTILKPYSKPSNPNHSDHHMVLSPRSVYVPVGSKFFVIKSFNESDIKSSFLHKIWSSTDLGNRRLNKAFKYKKPHERIFIFFSVNGSGKFCGIAEMISKVENPRGCDIYDEIWLEKSRWKGKFNIQWIFVKDIINSKLKHLKVPQNDWKPVTNSRDTQELPYDIGFAMIEIFKETPSRTSFLQTLVD